MKACIALHKSGHIDDHLVPKFKIKKKALVNNEEFDENGKQVGSRGREQFYDKKTPSFWQNKQKNQVALEDHEGFVPSKFERRLFWISVFDIDISLEPEDLHFRPMILITRKPLPPIPDIILFNRNQPFKVHVRSSSTPFSFVSDHHPPLLADYAFALMRSITNKEFQCQNTSDMAYYLAPLVRGSDTTILSSLHDKIDWGEVLKSICNNTKTCMSTDDIDDLEDIIEDTIVIDSSDQHNRQYVVKHIQYNMNPLSKVIMPLDENISTKPIREQGYESFAMYYQDQPYIKTRITDMHQPLLRVTRLQKSKSFLSVDQTTLKKEKESESAVYWLVPELCQIYPVAASVYQTLEVIPAIMTRIDATLLLLDAKNSIGLADVNLDFMLEAYTASSARMNVDYQRLEFFGGKYMNKN
jgi:endoribonuclease Dicer